MKGLRNKVILSGIVLLFAFIATIGSTYAWFTVSTQTTIEEFQLSITAADSLLIRPKLSTDVEDNITTTEVDEALLFLQNPANYGTNITASQLEEYLIDETTSLPNRLQPATVLGNGTGYLRYITNIGSLTFLNRTLTYDNALENQRNGHYIKLAFWILSQSEESKSVQLSAFDINVTGANEQSIQDDVENATRLSVVFDDTLYGGLNYNVDPLEHQSPVARGSYFLFGDNPDYSFKFEVTQTVDPFATEYISHGVATPPTVYSTASAAGNLFTVDYNEPTLIEVYIFVEGWDQDTTNNVIAAAFNISFGFKYEE